MKRYSIYFLGVFLCLGSMLITSSCEGPQGEQGIRGPQGEQGAPGPQGPTGQDGEDGNANIRMYHRNVSLENFGSNWGNDIWGASVPDMPTIAIGDMVSVFLFIESWPGDPDWTALPFLHYYNNSDIFNHHSFSITTEGSIWVYIRNSNGIQPYNTMTGNLSYRIFVASADGLQACDVDMNDYEALMECIEGGTTSDVE